MVWRTKTRTPLQVLLFVVCILSILSTAQASVGDRLPDFQACLDICKHENCNDAANPTHIPFYHRLLFWTCHSECDYTCQHIVTARRTEAGQPVTQFHGKWPFIRVLGLQEPFSVIFSLGNMIAHQNGLAKVHRHIPRDYPMRIYYELFAIFAIITWVCSTLFHARDFAFTEELDYFAASGNVLYGMYIAMIRVFRLAGGGSVGRPSPRRKSVLRAWTGFCITVYICHVAYLKFWRWNYAYNMAANITWGLIQNSLWSYYSFVSWRETRRSWTIWPGVAVAWIMMAMSMELLDFPPLWGAIDAHSLWHAGTIGPAILWYNFMVKDTEEDIYRLVKDTKA